MLSWLADRTPDGVVVVCTTTLALVDSWLVVGVAVGVAMMGDFDGVLMSDDPPEWWGVPMVHESDGKLLVKRRRNQNTKALIFICNRGEKCTTTNKVVHMDHRYFMSTSVIFSTFTFSGLKILFPY